jgi:hypothetical protein
MFEDDKANNLLYEIFTTSEVLINRQQSDLCLPDDLPATLPQIPGRAK